MGLILNLETATKVCSVTLAFNGENIATKELATQEFTHAENLNLFIDDVVKSADKKFSDVDAIAVSEGPGSYTGLRIGVSTAKGLCYALDKPLIAISSLLALTKLVEQDAEFICPMFDAMRMEVYTLVVDKKGTIVSPVEAHIISENSFSDFLESKKVLFVGPGAAKCQQIIRSDNALFDLDTLVSAKGMIGLSEEKFIKKDFVDVAYFEPYYLKDFVAGKKKN